MKQHNDNEGMQNLKTIDSLEEELGLLKEENLKLMKEIDRWVYFVVHGYHDLKEVLKNGKMSPEEVKDAIIEKFDGEVIKQTDEEYIKEQIEKNIVGLKKQDQNKILYQLKNGTITLDNLQACLDKIEVMQSR